MTNSPKFVMVPSGEMLSPHWRAIMAGPDGYKVVCAALLMRDMAVLCNAGGVICHPSGEPLTIGEIAACIGFDVAWLEPVLTRVLSKSGLFCVTEDSVVCTDPVLLAHIDRLGRNHRTPERPPVLILDGEPEGEETKGVREKRQGRNRKRLADYTKKWGCRPEEVRYQSLPAVTFRDKNATKALPANSNGEVTEPSETPDITGKNQALPYSIVLDDDIKQQQQNHHPVAVSSPNPSNPNPQTPVLSPAIQQAIEALPEEYQKHALQICQESTQAEEILLDSLFYFSAKIAKGKADGCGYLVDSIKKGWGKGCRKLAQEAEEKSEATRRRRQLVEAAQEEKKEAEKRKQVELQKLFLSLDDARREAVEQEAARRCREQFGGDFPSFAVAGAITNIMAELQAA